jgi:molecular chaperone GrpE
VADRKNSSGPASAGPGGHRRSRHGSDEDEPRIVIRDKRRIDRGTTAAARGDGEEAGTAAGAATKDDEESTKVTEPDETGEDVVEAPDAEFAEPVAADVADVVTGELVEEEATERRDKPDEAHSGLGAELAALRSELDERTRDLQRINSEYANYRKRVDRDRGVVAEQATGAVLVALLPVLDDLDRARDHGDLVGPFGSVAEVITAALTKFGLTPFGDKGDAFDPTRHEAVAHLTSADVTEPTCVDVMRRGYLLGERLLRPALVAVADPE